MISSPLSKKGLDYKQIYIYKDIKDCTTHEKDQEFLLISMRILGKKLEYSNDSKQSLLNILP